MSLGVVLRYSEDKKKELTMEEIHTCPRLLF
jgi:hypothetical protein